AHTASLGQSLAVTHGGHAPPVVPVSSTEPSVTSAPPSALEQASRNTGTRIQSTFDRMTVGHVVARAPAPHVLQPTASEKCRLTACDRASLYALSHAPLLPSVHPRADARGCDPMCR